MTTPSGHSRKKTCEKRIVSEYCRKSDAVISDMGQGCGCEHKHEHKHEHEREHEHELGGRNSESYGRLICDLCPRHCELEDGITGFCHARYASEGKIVCGNYGMITSLALDPIEKKPLYHFHPGSRILSAGSYGCNLRCPFCQNHEISMAGEKDAEASYIGPEKLVDMALELKGRGNIGIAYTYNEPLVGFEYVRDCSVLARESNLKNVLVTNGCFCEEPLREIFPLMDAVNIDLKGFSHSFYDKVGGDLETVKKAIKLSCEYCHVEVTTLVIPGENDSQDEIEAIASWLASISPDIPLHLSRFFPYYKMSDREATPVKKVYRLSDLARKHLRYVYEGNC